MIKHVSLVLDQFRSFMQRTVTNGRDRRLLPEEPQILRGELAQIREYRG